MAGSSTPNWVLTALRRSTAPRESRPACDQDDVGLLLLSGPQELHFCGNTFIGITRDYLHQKLINRWSEPKHTLYNGCQEAAHMLFTLDILAQTHNCTLRHHWEFCTSLRSILQCNRYSVWRCSGYTLSSSAGAKTQAVPGHWLGMENP